MSTAEVVGLIIGPVIAVFALLAVIAGVVMITLMCCYRHQKRKEVIPSTKLVVIIVHPCHGNYLVS